MRKGISLVGLSIALASIAVGMGSVRPAPIKVVETYERKCSSCHGKEGAMLDKDFEKKYASPSELREMVESMPGAIGMRSDELDAMLAYMRAVSRREPFVVWTGRQGDALLGEVSPATARVEARAKREKLRVERPQPISGVSCCRRGFAQRRSKSRRSAVLCVPRCASRTPPTATPNRLRG